MHRELNEIANDIRTNSDHVREGKITWEVFTQRNFALWDEVSRGEENIIGSACSKRHAYVLRYLELDTPPNAL